MTSTEEAGGFDMKRLATFAVLFLIGSVVGTTALAGIADSPLPVLTPGATTFHLYSVPGVIANGQGLDTFFSCTSLEQTASMQVGVELFFAGGGAPSNDAAA